MTVEERTLDILDESENYNRWTYDLIRGYLRGNILEVGCGIGKITRFLLRSDRKVLSIDLNKGHLARNRKRFKNNKNFRAIFHDISLKNGGLIKKKFDTIVCLNVLHHIKNQDRALRNMNWLLKEGRLILLEPALPGIYGTLDANEGCLRRYTKKSINDILAKNGFIVENCRYTNMVGATGWFVNSRILKRDILSVSQTRFYDKMVPLISFIERMIHPPIGLSLMCVCGKQSKEV